MPFEYWPSNCGSFKRRISNCWSEPAPPLRLLTGVLISTAQIEALQEALVTAVREAAGQGDGTSTVSFSEMNATEWNGIVQRMGLTTALREISPVPPSTRVIPAFGWDDRVESAQADRYMPHLRRIMNLGGRGFDWIRGDSDKALLSVTSGSLSRSLHGTCDAAIATRLAVRSLDYAQGLVGVFELKKVVEARHLHQAKAQVVAANIRSPASRPFGVLTDLNDSWLVFYLDGSTLYSISPENRAAAIAFIEQLLLTWEDGDSGGHVGSGPGGAPGGGGAGGGGAGVGEGAGPDTTSTGADRPSASKRRCFELSGPGAHAGGGEGGGRAAVAPFAFQLDDDVANLEDLEGFFPEEECRQMQMHQKLRMGLIEMEQRAQAAA